MLVLWLQPVKPLLKALSASIQLMVSGPIVTSTLLPVPFTAAHSSLHALKIALMETPLQTSGLAVESLPAQLSAADARCRAVWSGLSGSVEGVSQIASVMDSVSGTSMLVMGSPQMMSDPPILVIAACKTSWVTVR